MIAAMSFKWIHYMRLVYSVVMSAIKFFLFKITPPPFPVGLGLMVTETRELCKGNNIDCFFSFAGAIREKYGQNLLNKKWIVMRQSLNQKCLDIKNKKRPKAE